MGFMANRRGKTRCYPGRHLLVATSILVGGALVPRPATAGPVSTPGPRALLLRLDDSPSLPLLDPFRHAAGRPDSGLSHYLHGPYASWLNQPWKTLDWEAPFDPASHQPDRPRPINPNLEVLGSRREACRSRLDRQPAAWPFVAGHGHWFQQGLGVEGSLVNDPFPPSPQLEISNQVVPPWLRRLDAHWAHALVANAGCGPGGECSPGASFPAQTFATLWDALTPKQQPPPWWVCRERPVTVMRYGREQDSFVLLRCDGSIPEGALEKLSLLARPNGVPRPAVLPLEPEGSAIHGEWVTGIRMLHPRLLWLLHQVALKFPWRALYVYSGYRVPHGDLEPGTHRSQHGSGRALDIAVQGVAAEDLLRLCVELADTGCGYYPNNKFVHMDVRRRGAGGALWVDTSGPGQPSRYVNRWPGVVEQGRLVAVPTAN